MVQAQLHKVSNEVPAVDMRHGTHLGKPAVFFSAEDYFINLAKECRLTIIGKFYRGKPLMEEIRKVFIRQFQLTGSVKIAYFDPRHVYIDFSNEVDYNHVLFKENIDIGDAPMKVMKWTADFKPEKKHLLSQYGSLFINYPGIYSTGRLSLELLRKWEWLLLQIRQPTQNRGIMLPKLRLRLIF